MAGSPTFITDPSTKDRLDAKIVAASTNRGWVGPSCLAAPGSVTAQKERWFGSPRCFPSRFAEALALGHKDFARAMPAVGLDRAAVLHDLGRRGFERNHGVQGMGGDSCPVEFNFDPASFKVGDQVSYRVTGSLAGFPFAGVLLEVHEDYVVVTSEPDKPETGMRATRESRPVVDEADVR
jgi:hypothetical protein